MDTITVTFYQEIVDTLVDFVVILARYNGQWLWVKHKKRATYEIPGGHVEVGETVEQAAKRELEEETGAILYTLRPLIYYSVTGKTRVNKSGQESYGKLFFADIQKLGAIDSEIEKYELFTNLPTKLTYPAIQPHFIHYFEKNEQ